MDLLGKRIGFALTGSFCTFDEVFPQIKALVLQGAIVTPIASKNVYEMDTRFYPAHEVIDIMETLTGKKVLHTLPEVEPIGPKKLLDLMIIAPCTGNTLGKLANSIIDTAPLMAAKSHMRNAGPVLLAISTNDGLSGSAKNIGKLMTMKNIFFVPYGQDDPHAKPTSLVAHMEKIPESACSALAGNQLQPMLGSKAL